MGWLVAVHIGAGRYGERTTTETVYTTVLHEALETGRRLMTEPEHSPSSVTRAVRVACRILGQLERDPLTNCGYGSNLSADGVVECEASVACGSSRMVGACAGVHGVAEPSALAQTLLTQALDRQDTTVGREPPLVLVGDGARMFAAAAGLETATSEHELRSYQVTETATQQWHKWGTRIEGLEDDTTRLDTVGVVCVDPDGNIAAAVSSGGVLYKVPGRVGLAGCPRVGGDARNAASGNEQDHPHDKKRRRRDGNTCQGFAIACSGRGEQFLRSAFTQTLGRRLQDDSIGVDEALRCDEALTRCHEYFLTLWNPRLSFDQAQEDMEGERLEGGVLALRVSPLQRRSKRLRASSTTHQAPNQETDRTLSLVRTVQLGVGFTTPCMGVGYAHDKVATPQAQILRQPDRETQHLVVHLSGFVV